MPKIFQTFFAMLISLTILGSSSASAQDRAISKFFSRANEASNLEMDNADWAYILKKYISVGPTGINRFNYAAVTSADHARLSRYISNLGKIDPRTLNTNESHAYWINLYNSMTVRVVLDHYPVNSIREIKSGLFSPGPWDLPLVKVAGRSLTLNNIEHDILRATWRDPRVHYALNCASLGCPNLAAQPYSERSLDAQLEGAARSFINHPRGVFLKDGRLTLSSIYNWYAGDFGNGSEKAVLSHLEQYANPELRAQLRQLPTIDAYQYDWHLNSPDR